VSKKASELADDIREKYETSDHPAVHKVEVSGWGWGLRKARIKACPTWVQGWPHQSPSTCKAYRHCRLGRGVALSSV
jgi:hypothetical protein